MTNSDKFLRLLYRRVNTYLEKGIKGTACSARVRDRTGCWIMLAKEMGIVWEKQ